MKTLFEICLISILMLGLSGSVRAEGEGDTVLAPAQESEATQTTKEADETPPTPADPAPTDAASTVNFLGDLLDEKDAIQFKLLNYKRTELLQKQKQLALEMYALENERDRENESIPDKHKNFSSSFSKVEALEKRISDIDDQIYNIKQKMLDYEQNTTAIADYTAQLNKLGKLKKVHEEERERWQTILSDETRQLQSSGKSAHEANSRIDAKQKEIDKSALDLFRIDNQLSELLNRDSLKSAFRIQISAAFTVLVAIVILGFYWLAFRREDVARNIFSGEKGIQFITLFLIVIAIILFGIMGTLESRELSALLGALSGYILGKTSVPQSAEVPAEPVKPPEATADKAVDKPFEPSLMSTVTETDTQAAPVEQGRSQ